MRRLQVTLRLPPRLRHPIQELIGPDAPVRRSRLLYGNLLDETATRFVFYVEGAIEPYRTVLAEADDVRSVDITPVNEHSFYSLVERELRDGDRYLRRSLEGSGAIIIPPLEYTGDGAIRMTVLGDPDDLRTTLADLPTDLDVELEGTGRTPAFHASVPVQLTDRQREAVEAAVECGYYAVPREGSLADVADALGCASSTASNHLRKAQARVMTAVVTPHPPVQPVDAKQG